MIRYDPNRPAQGPDAAHPCNKRTRLIVTGPEFPVGISQEEKKDRPSWIWWNVEITARYFCSVHSLAWTKYTREMADNSGVGSKPIRGIFQRSGLLAWILLDMIWKPKTYDSFFARVLKSFARASWPLQALFVISPRSWPARGLFIVEGAVGALRAKHFPKELSWFSQVSGWTNRACCVWWWVCEGGNS